MDTELMEAQEDAYLFEAEQLREMSATGGAILDVLDDAHICKMGRAWTHHRPAVLARVDEVNSSVDAEIARLEAWREKEIDKATCGVRFLSNSIQKWCQETGNNLDTPYVKAKIKQGSERTETDDDFCEAHRGTDFVTEKTTLSPAKVAIKKAIKQGVELKGARIERGPDTFQIEPVGGAVPGVP